MFLAQCLFEGVVQLLGCKFLTLLEIELHELFVDFDNLVDDLCVCFLDGAERGLVAFRLEKTVDDSGPIG